MPGGSVYKVHTFKMETAQYITRIFTIQYNYMKITKHYKTENTEENTNTDQNKMIILPGNEPGPSSI
jgi:hypothetical protein